MGRGPREDDSRGPFHARTHLDVSHRSEKERPVQALVQETHGPTRSVNAGEVVSSPKRLVRIAGVFYLLVAIFGGFAEGFMNQKLSVAGDAVATAGNVVAGSSSQSGC
jgi:hypothetical protein